MPSQQKDWHKQINKEEKKKRKTPKKEEKLPKTTQPHKPKRHPPLGPPPKEIGFQNHCKGCATLPLGAET